MAFFHDQLDEITNSDGAKFMRFRDQNLCWMENVPVLFVRSIYDIYFEKIIDSPRISWIVQGTPGIGKSLFGIWLVNKIIKRNLAKKVPNFSILFVDVEGEYNQFVVSNGVASSYRCDANNLPMSEYIIVDSQPTSSVRGTTGVTKRIYISSDHNPYLDAAISSWNLKADASTRIHFHPFDLTEAKLLASGIGWSENHLNALFDIFGGSARLIAAAMRLPDNEISVTPKTRIESFIYDSMKLFFGLEDEENATVIFKKASLTLSRLFNDAQRHAAGNRALRVLSSSFRHHDAVEEPFWASRFMKFLAGAIQHEERQDILNELRTILEQKGIGVLHEYNAHKKNIS